MNIIEFIADGVMNITAVYVIPISTSLMVPMSAIALSLATIYIFIMALGIGLGFVQAPFGKFMLHAAKIWLITGVGLTAAGYGTFIIDFFASFQLGMLSLVTGGSGATTYQIIDGVLMKGIDAAAICQQNAIDAGWNIVPVFMWTVALLVTLVGTSLIVLAGGGAIILSQLMIAALLSIGPFFIVMLMTPQTSKFFDGWFSQMMNYTFVVVLVSVVMSFSINLFGSFLDQADMSGSGEVAILPIIAGVGILSAFLIYVIYQSMGMAAGLAGGLSLSAITLSHMAANAAPLTSRINPVSTRRDAQSGLASRDTRSGHFAAGNTALNPRYWQRSKLNFQSNWGMPQGGEVKNKSK